MSANLPEVGNNFFDGGIRLPDAVRLILPNFCSGGKIDVIVFFDTNGGSDG